MEQEIRDFITKLKSENEQRSKEMNKPDIAEYGYRLRVIQYNTTLDIIKQLETIVNKK